MAATGILSNTNLMAIYAILGEHLKCSPTEKGLAEHMKTLPNATVTDRHTGAEVQAPRRRNGTRATFGRGMVHQLDKHLRQALPRGAVPADHGDLLFYSQGGEFKWHRDTILAAGPADHKMHTLLVGLHTNHTGGETELSYEDGGRVHQFTESVTRGSTLLFKSDEMHCGRPVESGYKLALKIDYWLPNLLPAGPCECSNCEYPSSPHADYYDYKEDDEQMCNGWEFD